MRLVKVRNRFRKASGYMGSYYNTRKAISFQGDYRVLVCPATES